MDQYQMNPFGYSPTESGFNQFTSFSSASTYTSNQIQNVGHSRDVPIATEHKNPQMKPSPSSNSQMISFQSSDLYPNMSQQYPGTYELQYGENMKMKRSGVGSTFSRTTLHGPEHVIAERKRREKRSQRFIALSSIIPGLTKLDKASVLGDTIKYLKQLKERVKILEEEVATRTVESKSYDPLIDQQLPEVEARVSGKNVLIKVQCEKHEGCIKELIKEMEDMNLTTLNISVLAFGSSLLDNTIVAQIENENCLTLEEILEKLRDALTIIIGSSSKRSAC
ncbi:hypothetical protein ACJRO7_031239 [Eucalyptus globulus]|uniref:BHLH domain-containing protein n=1 Tax=Eucalyptus globulus TaxID=34317 RepID=A0ABD3JG07_EUCGL